MKKIVLWIVLFFWLYNFSYGYSLSGISTTWNTKSLADASYVQKWWIRYSDDGTYVFVWWVHWSETSNSLIKKYTLSTPFVLSSMNTTATETFDTWGRWNLQFSFSKNWERLYFFISWATGTNYTRQYNCSTWYLLSSCTSISSYQTSIGYTWVMSPFVTPDGTKFYNTANFWNMDWNYIYYYTLSTPYDISTKSLVSSKKLSGILYETYDLTVPRDWNSALFRYASTYYKYNLSTAFDISTATSSTSTSNSYSVWLDDYYWLKLLKADSSDLLTEYNTNFTDYPQWTPALITSTGTLVTNYSWFYLSWITLTQTWTLTLTATSWVQDIWYVYPNTPINLYSEYMCYLPTDNWLWTYTYMWKDFTYSVYFEPTSWTGTTIINTTSWSLDFSGFLNNRGSIRDDSIDFQRTWFSLFDLNTVLNTNFFVIIDWRWQPWFTTISWEDKNIQYNIEWDTNYNTQISYQVWWDPREGGILCDLYNEDFLKYINNPPYWYDSWSGGTGSINIYAPNIEDQWNAWDTDLSGDLSVLEMLAGPVVTVKQTVFDLWDLIVKIMNLWNVEGGQSVISFFIPTANADLFSEFNEGMESESSLTNIINYLKYGALTIIFFAVLLIILLLISKNKKW